MTQLLSFAGYAAEFNIIVWEWGVFFIFPILSSVYWGMTQYTYDEAYKKQKNKDTYASVAKALQVEIMQEWNSYLI